MGSPQNPIGNQPNDPYERYRIEAIEHEKRMKEEGEKQLPVLKKNIGIVAQILSLFRKIIEFFEDRISAAEEKEARENLLQFKAALEILKSEDRSQDLPFLNALSKIWERMLEDTLRFKKETSTARKFKEFIKKIQSFPQNQEHSFGYYLTEQAGQKWLPFPYMEMILKLHAQHQKTPKNSTLHEWSEALHKLIASLSNVD